MLKYASVFGLIMVLVLAAAPAWAGDSVSGYWDGQWTCTSGPCDKAPSGFMSANLQQDDNHNVTSEFVMNGTVEGSLRCKVKKAVVASDFEFAGTIMCGSRSVGLAGKFSGDHFEGQYDGGSLGIGTLKMNR